MNNFDYPNFIPSIGNLTDKIRYEYISSKIIEKRLDYDSFDNEKITSLIASNDINDEVYFWQLYSILGEKPIHKLIHTFYTRIFNDFEEAWFRDEFIESGSIEYHVIGQKKFWLDIMGGGPLYKGGELKLNFKHKLVENIMNLEGAKRWMYHMTLSLKDLKFHLINDKRIIKCIMRFLYFFMKKYSVEFDFNFFKLYNESKL
jgi:truncated hemoglobin YjbI